MWRTCATWLSGSAEVLFPRECLICTRPLKGRSLCWRCHPPEAISTASRCVRCFSPQPALTSGEGCSTCKLFPPPTDHLRYLWEYGDLSRDFIRVMKYKPSVYLTRYGAQVLAQAIPTLFPGISWDLIVPIPSSPLTVKRRGFHPCYEMARVVRNSLPSCAISHALHHTRSRTPQARRTHNERLEGVRTLFAVRSPSTISGKRVLLLEDVITTGATIAAASHALRAAKASRVDVVALAQARIWSRFRRSVHDVFGAKAQHREPVC
jgi:predicted amidophosphoribosyltransferase